VPPNLLTCNNGLTQQEWFDFVVIDETSQMDVAHAVLVGDPLQLPPIHQAEPPIGIEDLVGSIYACINEYTVCRKVRWALGRVHKILTIFW
jgi:hypothetical protein